MMGGNFKAFSIGRHIWISLTLLLEIVIKKGLVNVSETTARFYPFFKASSSSRVSAAKQTMQSIAIATVQLTTTETTITYHNAICLSPQDFT